MNPERREQLSDERYSCIVITQKGHAPRMTFLHLPGQSHAEMKHEVQDWRMSLCKPAVSAHDI